MKRLSMILALISMLPLAAVAEEAAPSSAPTPGTQGGMNQALPNPNWQNLTPDLETKKRAKLRQAGKSGKPPKSLKRKAKARSKKRRSKRSQ